jgi:hypothetical protein
MLAGLDTIMFYSKKYGYYVLAVCVVALVSFYVWQNSWQNRSGIFKEGFQDGWSIASCTSLENAHGSAPAGVNAVPGEKQYKQNSDGPHVNPANKKGNPENTHPELKKQPLFHY